jgi:hypothetical protein
VIAAFTSAVSGASAPVSAISSIALLARVPVDQKLTIAL